MKDLYLILDVDGTLVDYNGEKDIIVPRSGLGQFLAHCFKCFAVVGIWTAADQSWYDRVYKEVLKQHLPDQKEFAFVLTGTRCSTMAESNGGIYPRHIKVKPLKKFWQSLLVPSSENLKGIETLTLQRPNRHNTLIVDDTPGTYQLNYGNAVPIKSFDCFDQSVDQELEKLTVYMTDVLIPESKSKGSIRYLEKRNWSKSTTLDSAGTDLLAVVPEEIAN